MCISCTVTETFSIKYCRDLAMSVRDSSTSRSLKMALIDGLYTTYYWSVIVSIALSVIVYGLLDVKEYRDIEIT